jgi:hypothetical protein
MDQVKRRRCRNGVWFGKTGELRLRGQDAIIFQANTRESTLTGAADPAAADLRVAALGRGNAVRALFLLSLT